MTSISGVSRQDHAPDQSILPSKKHCPGTPPFSNYFSILTGYFGISASYHRLYARGGHVIVQNVSARSARGETEPVSGVFGMQSPTIGAVSAGEERIKVLQCARSCSQARASWRRNHQISSRCRICPFDRGCMRRIPQDSSICDFRHSCHNGFPHHFGFAIFAMNEMKHLHVRHIFLSP